MKILITGIATSFIGSHTGQRLQALGHTVLGIYNISPYYDVQIKIATAKIVSEQNIQILEADLRANNTQTSLSTDFDYIFHFTAQPGISSAVSFEEYFDNDVIANQKLVEFIGNKNKDLHLFVNIATYSIHGKEAFYSEERVAQRASNYIVSKLSAEQLVLCYAREDNLKACSLLLYSVFGPREFPDKLYPKLIHSAFIGEPFTLFEGSKKHLRSFKFVDGIVSVIGNEVTINREVINLGTEIESTTQQRLDRVEKLTGKIINIVIVLKRASHQLRTRAIIYKARKILNYNPSTSLQKGIAKHILVS